MPRKGATLELAVLGLLQETPLHGYELRKRLNLLLGWTRLLSYGSLYPALKRMLRAGWITEVTTSNAVSRRQRIVYQITPAGIEFFTSEITEAGPAAWEDETFNMRFAFFSRTDATVRLRILEGRRSRLQERLDRARALHGEDDRYLSELRRHSIESVEREVRWLTDLIETERSNSDRTGSRTTPVKPRAAAKRRTAPLAGATDPTGTSPAATGSTAPAPTPAPTPATTPAAATTAPPAETTEIS
ncbi:PadR family transcriptional regulator [Nocardioides pocheonensis]|uniref:PadR family transcriptional regulator n=1 Tax=Nocardioides pocheonensis TaxID=661485 RepID=A0A3N0GJF2_9ACTN|nr:PadR family transcriptional regulator [Nocardioides pocheonensis]RNM12569.1 PadR family transcriptional regulator [Nocardioides pocheonensis]